MQNYRENFDIKSRLSILNHGANNPYFKLIGFKNNGKRPSTVGKKGLVVSTAVKADITYECVCDYDIPGRMTLMPMFNHEQEMTTVTIKMKGQDKNMTKIM